MLTRLAIVAQNRQNLETWVQSVPGSSSAIDHWDDTVRRSALGDVRKAFKKLKGNPADKGLQEKYCNSIVVAKTYIESKPKDRVDRMDALHALIVNNESALNQLPIVLLLRKSEAIAEAEIIRRREEEKAQAEAENIRRREVQAKAEAEANRRREEKIKAENEAIQRGDPVAIWRRREEEAFGRDFLTYMNARAERQLAEERAADAALAREYKQYELNAALEGQAAHAAHWREMRISLLSEGQAPDGTVISRSDSSSSPLLSGEAPSQFGPRSDEVVPSSIQEERKTTEAVVTPKTSCWARLFPCCCGSINNPTPEPVPSSISETTQATSSSQGGTHSTAYVLSEEENRKNTLLF